MAAPVAEQITIGGKYSLAITISESGDGGIVRFSGAEVNGEGKVMSFLGKDNTRHGHAFAAFNLVERPKPPEQKSFQERLDELGPGAGTEGLRMFHEMGMIDCSQCWRLAGVMNRKGTAWCRSESGMSYCVEDAIDRAVAFWNNATAGEKMRAWMKSQLSVIESAKIGAAIAADKESGLRTLLERLFTAAIDAAEVKERNNGST